MTSPTNRTPQFTKSIAEQDARDITVIVTFAPEDAPDLVEICAEGRRAEHLSHSAYVALVEETAHRLALYARAYRAALQDEAASVPLVAADAP